MKNKYRRKIKKSHPWKCINPQAFAKRPSSDYDLYAYVAEGVKERQIKAMGKDNRGKNVRECGSMNTMCGKDFDK